MGVIGLHILGPCRLDSVEHVNTLRHEKHFKCWACASKDSQDTSSGCTLYCLAACVRFMEGIVEALASGAVSLEELLEWCTTDSSICSPLTPIASRELKCNEGIEQYLAHPSVFRQAFLTFVRHQADALLQVEQAVPRNDEVTGSLQRFPNTRTASSLSTSTKKAGHASLCRADFTSAAPTLSEKNFPSLAVKSNGSLDTDHLSSRQENELFSRPVGGSSRGAAVPSRRIAVTKVCKACPKLSKLFTLCYFPAKQ
jgi:hypothetical protein